MTRVELPDEMIISYFKMDTGFKSLEFKNNQIEFDFLKKIVTPSNIEWGQFWDKLEEIDFWHWDEDYEKCCLVDGFEWNIKITKGNNSMESSGINDGPTQVVGDKLIFLLDEFLDALEDLTGFRID
ncbi:hypothetical protein [Methanobacterium alcaliphilum]|uniref:hypothetical protein n=1 Tax=Methanobacterium alcaliphilum TaxID=392018 RepID=UPI00200B6FFE|nr:hypothetical protein [Methanobacterium alcaliphilum]MCK9150788.1 hypothetical protein [Methanobacterium alcaliphilum]